MSDEQFMDPDKWSTWLGMLERWRSEAPNWEAKGAGSGKRFGDWHIGSTRLVKPKNSYLMPGQATELYARWEAAGSPGGIEADEIYRAYQAELMLVRQE